jgi:hypothetical protein
MRLHYILAHHPGAQHRVRLAALATRAELLDDEPQQRLLQTSKQTSANRSNGRCMLHAAIRPLRAALLHLATCKCCDASSSESPPRRLRKCSTVARTSCNAQRSAQRLALHKTLSTTRHDATAGGSRARHAAQPRSPRSAAAVATQRRRGSSVRRCLHRRCATVWPNGLAMR